MRTARGTATGNGNAASFFGRLCAAAGVPEPVPEFTFHSGRRWRFDYAWPDCKLALEVEGGAFTRGRHTRGAGFVKDMEKYNTATLAGWRILRVTPDQLLSHGIDLIKAAEWRLVRVKAGTPGGHGSWVETNHPAVIACMGSIPACEQGCQARIISRTLLAALEWAERQFAALVTEDDGSGVFIKGQGVELGGFGAGREQLREAIKVARACDPTEPRE